MEDPDSPDLDEDLMAALALSLQEVDDAGLDAGDQTEPAAEESQVREADDDAPPEAPDADEDDDDAEAELLAAMALSLQDDSVLIQSLDPVPEAPPLVQTTPEPAAEPAAEPVQTTPVPEADDEAQDTPPEAPDDDDDGEAELLAAMALSLELNGPLVQVDLDGNAYQYNEQTGQVEYDAAAPAAPPTLEQQEAMITSLLRDNCTLPTQPAASETGNFTCTKGHPLTRELHERNWCDRCSVTCTSFRCSQGCDYDICQGCWDKEVATGKLGVFSSPLLIDQCLRGDTPINWERRVESVQAVIENQGVIAAHLTASALNVVKLCRLGLLDSLIQGMNSEAHSSDESTLSGLLELVHINVSSLFEWHQDETVSMFKVVSPHGVAFRHTPHLEDRKETRQAPMCGTWVTGRLVQGTAGILFVKVDQGYLPMTSHDGTVLIIEAPEAFEVSGAGTEQVNGQYYLMHHASWATYEGVHLPHYKNAATASIVCAAGFRHDHLEITGEIDTPTRKALGGLLNANLGRSHPKIKVAEDGGVDENMIEGLQQFLSNWVQEQWRAEEGEAAVVEINGKQTAVTIVSKSLRKVSVQVVGSSDPPIEFPLSSAKPPLVAGEVSGELNKATICRVHKFLNEHHELWANKGVELLPQEAESLESDAVQALQLLLNACWHKASACPRYCKRDENSIMILDRRGGREWWITQQTGALGESDSDTAPTAFYFAKTVGDSPHDIKWEDQRDGVSRAISALRSQLTDHQLDKAATTELLRKISELELAVASGITAAATESGIPIGESPAPLVRPACIEAVAAASAEELHLEKQAISWAQRLHKTVMGIGLKTEKRIGEVLGMGDCVVLEDLLARFYEQPSLLEVVVSLTAKQTDIRNKLTFRMARYKAAVSQLMDKYQLQCASVLLPALVHSFTLAQPPRVEKIALRELHHLLLHAPAEAFSRIAPKPRAALFSLTHRLIRRKPLTDVVIGLKLVQALLRWAEDTAHELQRYGTLQAVEALYRVEQQVQIGMRRVVSGATKPSAVRELAERVASDLAAKLTDVGCQMSPQPLALLAPRLTAGEASAMRELARMLNDSESITAFELSECGIPAALSAFLATEGIVSETEHAARAKLLQKELGAVMPQLVLLLHDALYLLEDLPVYRHQAGGAIHGVKSLLYPCKVSLRGLSPAIAKIEEPGTAVAKLDSPKPTQLFKHAQTSNTDADVMPPPPAMKGPQAAAAEAADAEAAEVGAVLTVEGAGSDAVNGRYEVSATSDGVSMWHQKGSNIFILRWNNAGADARPEHQGKEWFIADLGPNGLAGSDHNNIDYYVADSRAATPPQSDWNNLPRSTFKVPKGRMPFPTIKGGSLPVEAQEDPRFTVYVEPLTEYSLIRHQVLRTAVIQDPKWHLFCREIVGAKIKDENGRAADVLAVRIVASGQIVHKLQYTDDESIIWMVLAVFNFSILESSPADALADFQSEPVLEESLSIRNSIVNITFDFDRAAVAAASAAAKSESETPEEAAADDGDGIPEAWKDSLEFLMGMGFAGELTEVYGMTEIQICLACLHKANGDGNAAFELLMSQNIPALPEAPKVKPPAPSSIVWEAQDEANKWQAYSIAASARIEQAKSGGQTELSDVQFLGETGSIDLVEMLQRQSAEEHESDAQSSVRRRDLQAESDRTVQLGLEKALNTLHTDNGAPDNPMLMELRQMREIIDISPAAVQVIAGIVRGIAITAAHEMPHAGLSGRQSQEAVLKFLLGESVESSSRSALNLLIGVLRSTESTATTEGAHETDVLRSGLVSLPVALCMHEAQSIGSIKSRAADELVTFSAICWYTAAVVLYHSCKTAASVSSKEVLAVHVDHAVLSTSELSYLQRMLCERLSAAPGLPEALQQFLGLVMEPLKAAMVAADAGEAPFGHSIGDDYTFQSRGFAGGQIEFQMLLRSIATQSTIPIARGCTEHEGEILMGRLAGLCELSVTTEEESGAKYLTAPLPRKRTGYEPGCRVQAQATFNDNWTAGTILAREDGKHCIVYDNGVFEENLPEGRIRTAATHQSNAKNRPMAGGPVASGLTLKRELSVFETHDKAHHVEHSKIVERNASNLSTRGGDNAQGISSTIKKASLKMRVPVLEVAFGLQQPTATSGLSNWICKRPMHVWRKPDMGRPGAQAGQVLKPGMVLTVIEQRSCVGSEKLPRDALWLKLLVTEGSAAAWVLSKDRQSTYAVPVDPLPAHKSASPPPATKGLAVLPAEMTFFESIHNMLNFTDLWQAQQLYELQYCVRVKNPVKGKIARTASWNAGALLKGKEPPWNVDTVEQQVSELGLTRTEFVKQLQELAKREWLDRMEMLGKPQVVAQRNDWGRLLMVYRMLCGSGLTPRKRLSPSKRKQKRSLDEELELIGFSNANARSVVTALGALHSCAELLCPASGWINQQLSAKLAVQLDDALAIASSTIPPWCHKVSKLCPFMLSFEHRRSLFECTAFGTSHAVYWLQERAIDKEAGETRIQFKEADRRNQEFNRKLEAGKLTEEEVSIWQNKILPDREYFYENLKAHQLGQLKAIIRKIPHLKCVSSLSYAVELVKQHRDVSAQLEVQFEEDGGGGFGDGVTQGFYARVAKLLQHHEYNLIFDIWSEIQTEIVNDGVSLLKAEAKRLVEGKQVDPLNLEEPFEVIHKEVNSLLSHKLDADSPALQDVTLRLQQYRTAKKVVECSVGKVEESMALSEESNKGLQASSETGYSKWRVVFADGINVRRKPQLSSERLGTAPQGLIVHVTEKRSQDGEWIMLADWEGQTECWMRYRRKDEHWIIPTRAYFAEVNEDSELIIRQKALRAIIAKAECVRVPDTGLFPNAVLQTDSVALNNVCSQFKFIGRLLGTSMRDNFVVGLPLSVQLFAALRGDVISCAALPQAHQTGGMVSVCRAIGEELEVANRKATNAQERLQLTQQILEGPCKTYVDAQGLKHLRFADEDFSGEELTLQQYYDAAPFTFVDPNDVTAKPHELCPGGADREVELSADSLLEYSQLVVNWWFNEGVQRQIKAFKEGIDEVFPVASLQAFSAQELQRMFCGELCINWAPITSSMSPQTVIKHELHALARHLNVMRPYSKDSPVFKMLVAELVEMNNEQRGDFLEFTTSKRCLPVNGLQAAGITIATEKKPGDVLPFGQTCTKTLHIPPYGSKTELRAALQAAMMNGSEDVGFVERG